MYSPLELQPPSAEALTAGGRGCERVAMSVCLSACLILKEKLITGPIILTT